MAKKNERCACHVVVDLPVFYVGDVYSLLDALVPAHNYRNSILHLLNPCVSHVTTLSMRTAELPVQRGQGLFGRAARDQVLQEGIVGTVHLQVAIHTALQLWQSILAEIHCQGAQGRMIK